MNDTATTKPAPKFATVTLTCNGVTYRGEGRTRDEALSALKVVEKEG